MRYKSLDANLLVMLDIILEQESVTRTSELMGLTQSAVSHALARLREHFGDDLIVQVSRQGILTPLAKRLRQPLKDWIRQTAGLVSMRAGFDPSVDVRHFSIVCSDYVAWILAYDVLRTVATKGPALSVAYEGISSATFERFERGEIDMALMPRQFALESHPMVAILDDTFTCVVWKGNKRVSDSLSLEDYLGCRHVVRTTGKGPFEIELCDMFLSQSGWKRTAAVEVPSFSETLEILVGTDLVATVQTRLAQKMIQDRPLRTVCLPVDFPRASIVMQWHRHMHEDGGSKWFRDIVIEKAANLAS